MKWYHVLYLLLLVCVKGYVLQPRSNVYPQPQYYTLQSIGEYDMPEYTEGVPMIPDSISRQPLLSSQRVVPVSPIVAADGELYQIQTEGSDYMWSLENQKIYPEPEIPTASLRAYLNPLTNGNHMSRKNGKMSTNPVISILTSVSNASFGNKENISTTFHSNVVDKLRNGPNAILPTTYTNSNTVVSSESGRNISAQTASDATRKGKYAQVILSILSSIFGQYLNNANNANNNEPRLVRTEMGKNILVSHTKTSSGTKITDTVSSNNETKNIINRDSILEDKSVPTLSFKYITSKMSFTSTVKPLLTFGNDVRHSVSPLPDPPVTKLDEFKRPDSKPLLTVNSSDLEKNTNEIIINTTAATNISRRMTNWDSSKNKMEAMTRNTTALSTDTRGLRSRTRPRTRNTTALSSDTRNGFRHTSKKLLNSMDTNKTVSTDNNGSFIVRTLSDKHSRHGLRKTLPSGGRTHFLTVATSGGNDPTVAFLFQTQANDTVSVSKTDNKLASFKNNTLVLPKSNETLPPSSALVLPKSNETLPPSSALVLPKSNETLPPSSALVLPKSNETLPPTSALELLAIKTSGDYYHSVNRSKQLQEINNLDNKLNASSDIVLYSGLSEHTLPLRNGSPSGGITNTSKVNISDAETKQIDIPPWIHKGPGIAKEIIINTLRNVKGDAKMKWKLLTALVEEMERNLLRVSGGVNPVLQLQHSLPKNIKKIINRVHRPKKT